MFCLSCSACAERSFSRLKQLESSTRSTMDEIRLSDLSVLNIGKEFSENLDFNSVVNTFAKNLMKNRRKQLVYIVSLLGLCIM